MKKDDCRIQPKKNFTDPETGKPITYMALFKKLGKASADRCQCKTPIGDFSFCVKIAAFRKALGLPLPQNLFLNNFFYGQKVKWETSRFERGVPTVDFEKVEEKNKERETWTEIDITEGVTWLKHNDVLLVQLIRLSNRMANTLSNRMDDKTENALTDKEWKMWVGLVAASPDLLHLARLVVEFLTEERIINMPIGHQQFANQIYTLAQNCLKRAAETGS